VFAAASIPEALLVNRFGARWIVSVGLCGLGACALLRAAPPGVASLSVWTGGLALAIAVAQPALSTIVRAWFPSASQQVSAAYAASVNLGGLAGAVLTTHLLGLGGWRGNFFVWVVPATLVGLLWLWLAPGRKPTVSEPQGLGRLPRDPAVWHAAALFGMRSLVYFTAGTWLPFLVRARGQGYVALVLFALNVTNAPTNGPLAVIRRPGRARPRFTRPPGF
jgi:cyanate permease